LKNIKLVVLFKIVLSILLISSILLLFRFQSKIDTIKDKYFNTYIENMENVTFLIKNHVSNKLSVYSYKALQKNYKLQDELNYFLQTFNKQDQKDIFILEVPKQNEITYTVLASGDLYEDYKFGDDYEPLSEDWNRILKEKTPVYFKNGIRGTWFTYQYPLIKDDKIMAIITIDFSIENYQEIKQNIEELNVLFKEYMYFMLFIIMTLVILSLINTTIEKSRLKLFKDLQEETSKVNNLNKTLEERVNLRTKELVDSKKEMRNYINIVNKNIISSSADLEGKITYASDAFCKISGYTKKELLGQNHNIVKHEDNDPLIYKNIWDNISCGKAWKGEIKNKKKSGEAYWVDGTIEPTFDENQNIIGYTSIRQDITDKKKVEELSITDKLTKLFNRHKIDEVFQEEIQRAKRYDCIFSVILLDIDHFKSVNDTYGHDVGDVVIKNISKLLKQSIRVTDIVGRWGGEEFIIIAIETNYKDAMNLAQNIKKSIQNYKHDKVGFKTASFGVTTYKKGDSEELMLNRADGALYKAKNEGRNQVCLSL